MITEHELSVAFVEQFDRIVSYCQYKFKLDLDSARDLVQGAFAKAWEKRSSFKSDCSLKAWLFTIAINASINHLRQSDVRYKLTTGYFPDWMLRRITSPEEKLMLSDAINVFKTLSNRNKAIFGLVYFHGLKFGEVAKVFGIHQSNVTRNLDKTRQKMLEVL